MVHNFDTVATREFYAGPGRWNDPDIGVEWPLDAPILSERDQKTESFAEFTKRVRSR